MGKSVSIYQNSRAWVYSTSLLSKDSEDRCRRVFFRSYFLKTGSALALSLVASCTASLSSPTDLEVIIQNAAKEQMDLIKEQAAATDSIEWWTELGDLYLVELVKVAHIRNTDVRTAYSRIAEVRGQQRASRSDLYPTVNLSESAGISESDLTNGANEDRSFDLLIALEASWEVDVFGRIRKTAQAADLRTSATEALLRDTLRVVTSELAETYVQFRSIQARLKLSREIESRRIENLDRIQRLLKANYATIVDLRRSESQLYEIRARIAQFEALEVQLSNQIAVLVGLKPDMVREFLVSDVGLRDLPGEVPLPTAERILRNRPDVRARDLQLAAAAAEVDAAKAALYPRLTLSSTLQTGSSGNNSFSRLDGIAANAIAGLTAPLLNRGRLLADIDIQSARVSAAYADYEDSIIRALADIDTSYAQLTASRTAMVQRQSSALTATQAAELTRQLFAAGEIDYTSVVFAEETRADQEDAAITAHAEALAAYIRYMSAASPAW